MSWRLVVHVYLVALELGSVEGVRSQRSALEPVADVREIRDPAQVDRDRVERHEEPGEQEERD